MKRGTTSLYQGISINSVLPSLILRTLVLDPITVPTLNLISVKHIKCLQHRNRLVLVGLLVLDLNRAVKNYRNARRTLLNLGTQRFPLLKRAKDRRAITLQRDYQTKVHTIDPSVMTLLGTQRLTRCSNRLAPRLGPIRTVLLHHANNIVSNILH